jgi:predicted transcriptional regulator
LQQYCRGKTKTYSESVFVVLGIKHVMRKRYIVTNYIVSVNTTNKFKFLLRHVLASQGHHQAYKEVPMNLDYYGYYIIS